MIETQRSRGGLKAVTLVIIGSLAFMAAKHMPADGIEHALLVVLTVVAGFLVMLLGDP